MPDQLMFSIPKEWVLAEYYKDACVLLSDFAKVCRIEQSGCCFEYYFLTKYGKKKFGKIDDVLLTK